jgi:hypothetical protein
MSQTPTDDDAVQYMVGLNESESFGHLIEEPSPLPGIRPRREFNMLVTKKPNPAIPMLEGWAISVLVGGWRKLRGTWLEERSR